MIMIRLARAGRLNRPIYTIVAINSRSARNGKFLEKLGQYNPSSPAETLKSVNVEGINKWLAEGAQLSDTVRTIFKKEKVQVNL